MKRLLADMLDTLPAANRDLCPYCSLDTNPELDHFCRRRSSRSSRSTGATCFPSAGTCNRRKPNRFRTTPGGERYFLFPRSEPAVAPCSKPVSCSLQERFASISYRRRGGGSRRPRLGSGHSPLPNAEARRPLREAAHAIWLRSRRILRARRRSGSNGCWGALLNGRDRRTSERMEAGAFRAIGANLPQMLHWLLTP